MTNVIERRISARELRPKFTDVKMDILQAPGTVYVVTDQGRDALALLSIAHFRKLLEQAQAWDESQKQGG